jgi:hypothetical protein
VSLAEPKRPRREEALCSDIRDTCVVGEALRRHASPTEAIRESLDERLFRGHRPSLRPLTRVQAVSEILALHCKKHRPQAEAFLVMIATPTRPPGESGEG